LIPKGIRISLTILELWYSSQEQANIIDGQQPFLTFFHPLKKGRPMSHLQLSKIECKTITQVGIAVKNLEQVALNYWEIPGIGPWAVFD
jgi:hypothetical protein